MAEETIVEKDGRKYTIENVKAGREIVGLSPTIQMIDLDDALQLYPPESIFKLFLRQLKTDHKNQVRARSNGKIGAMGVIDAIARKVITTEQIEALQEPKGKDASGVWNLPFMDAANQLLQANTDSKRIHWDVGEVFEVGASFNTFSEGNEIAEDRTEMGKA